MQLKIEHTTQPKLRIMKLCPLNLQSNIQSDKLAEIDGWIASASSEKEKSSTGSKIQADREG
jgi:hypothetical protein